MVSIEVLMKEGKVSRIRELELERYTNFFDNSYKDNLEHSKANMKEFPRWSIISGYFHIERTRFQACDENKFDVKADAPRFSEVRHHYAMHDITKLLIAKKFRLKIELEVHATTIKVLRELIKDREVTDLIEKGYREFISLANDLAEAKKQWTESQYYTGTKFSKEQFQKLSGEFLSQTVIVDQQKNTNILLLLSTICEASYNT